MTKRTVVERVCKIQNQTGAGGVRNLGIRFTSRKGDVAIERAIHAYLESKAFA